MGPFSRRTGGAVVSIFEIELLEVLAIRAHAAAPIDLVGTLSLGAVEAAVPGEGRARAANTAAHGRSVVRNLGHA